MDSNEGVSKEDAAKRGEAVERSVRESGDTAAHRSGEGTPSAKGGSPIAKRLEEELRGGVDDPRRAVSSAKMDDEEPGDAQAGEQWAGAVRNEDLVNRR